MVGVVAVDAEGFMRRLGFRRVYLVVFDLPTEYSGMELKPVKSEKGLGFLTFFRENYLEFARLRARFYYYLRGVAYRTTAGWVLVSEPDEKLHKVFGEVVKRLNELSGNSRSIDIVEAFLPVTYLRDQLAHYISELERARERLIRRFRETEDYDKAVNIAKKINRFARLIDRLRAELENLNR